MTRWKVLRFAVADDHGRISGIWRVWAQDASSGRAACSDVYLANRSIAGHAKVSLHQSGAWHWALTREAYDAGGLPLGWTAPDRFADRWQRPPEFTPGWTMGFRLLIPESELHGHGKVLRDQDVTWLRPPGSSSTAEISLLFGRGTFRADSWPGQRSMGTELLWRVPLLSGETLFVVRRDLEVTREMKLQLQDYKTQLSRMAGDRVDLEKPTMRMILYGHQPDSSRHFIDCRAA